MTDTVSRKSINAFRSIIQTKTTTTVPVATDWYLMHEDIAIQITGTCTSIIAVVQRSTEDPTLTTANPAAIDSSPITGNAVTGINPEAYFEPGYAWWRVNVTSVGGGTANIYITGKNGS